MTVSLVMSLLLAVIGVVLWIEGGPHPRTWGAWLLLGVILIISTLPMLMVAAVLLDSCRAGACDDPGAMVPPHWPDEHGRPLPI